MTWLEILDGFAVAWQRANKPNDFDESILKLWRVARLDPEALAEFWRKFPQLLLTPEEDRRIRSKMFWEGIMFSASSSRVSSTVPPYTPSRRRRGQSRRRRRPASVGRQIAAPAPAPLNSHPLADLLKAAGERMAADGLIQKEANELLKPHVRALPRRRSAGPNKQRRAPFFSDEECAAVARLYDEEIARQESLPPVRGRARYKVKVPNDWWMLRAVELRGAGATVEMRNSLRIRVSRWRDAQNVNKNGSEQ